MLDVCVCVCVCVKLKKSSSVEVRLYFPGLNAKKPNAYSRMVIHSCVFCGNDLFLEQHTLLKPGHSQSDLYIGVLLREQHASSLYLSNFSNQIVYLGLTDASYLSGKACSFNMILIWKINRSPKAQQSMSVVCFPSLPEQPEN